MSQKEKNNDGVIMQKVATIESSKDIRIGVYQPPILIQFNLKIEGASPEFTTDGLGSGS